MSADECEKCGHSPVLRARVVRDKISLSTGEFVARGGDEWTMCLYCDCAGIVHVAPPEVATARRVCHK